MYKAELMEKRSVKTDSRTKLALFGASILGEPLSTLYCFVPVILCKDLHASAFEIALLMTLKPVVTLLSFYWSARSGGRLKANTVGAGIWMRLPFLLLPLMNSVWFVILASVNYMLFYRAGMPAWIEILKRNLPERHRGWLFSCSAAIGYGEGVLLGLAMGALLDHDPGLWRILFALAALVGLGGVAMQARIPVEETDKNMDERADGSPHQPARPCGQFWRLLVQPWKDTIDLMRRQRDFSLFQWGFMICGLALMIIQPVIPLFAVNELKINYLQMAGAVSVVKGFGYVLSSPFWGRWIRIHSIHRLSNWIFLIFALFPLMLILAKWQFWWFYTAYFWYGVGQGGSHLVWNLSGPYFAKNQDSARFSGVNMAMLGIRGAVGPMFGAWMLGAWGALPVLSLSIFLCLWSGILLFRYQVNKSLAINR
jgi:MFS family permease